jgi:hypothetical protein
MFASRVPTAAAAALRHTQKDPFACTQPSAKGA